MMLLSSPKPTSKPRLPDAFCLRLTLAILYRAGLDALDETSLDSCEAQEFLRSDFALLARKVLLSKAARDIDFGETSDYLGQYLRISKHQSQMSVSYQKKSKPHQQLADGRRFR
jgi:hypothetical protein